MPVSGAYEVLLEKRGDDRGFFARAFCEEEMKAHGIPTRFVQHNIAQSAYRGTLRGLHFQSSPHEEGKFVRCIKGSLFDFMVDIRPDSPTFKNWFGVELTPEKKNALYIPEGCAHGYLTLEEDTEALYMSTANYTPEAEGGYRWNDPAFRIEYPIDPLIISSKDSNWPDFDG